MSVHPVGHQKSNPIKFVSNELKNSDFVKNIAKIIKNTLSIVGKISSAPAIGKSVAFLGSVTDTFKVLSFFKATNELIENINKPHKSSVGKFSGVLKIASSVNSIALSVLSGCDIARQIGLIEFAKVSKALGGVPIIGKALTFTPFGTVVTILELIDSVISITVSSIKIHKINQKIDKIETKINKWDLFDPFDVTDQATQTFHAKKKEKWENKLKTRELQRAKEIKSIAINCAVIVTVVAMIALGLFGLMTPPVAITIGAAFLIITIAVFANSLHNKYWLDPEAQKAKQGSQSVPAMG